MSTEYKIFDFARVKIIGTDGESFFGVVESSDIVYEERNGIKYLKGGRGETIKCEFELRAEDMIQIMRGFCNADLISLISHHKTAIAAIDRSLKKGHIGQGNCITKKLGYEFQMLNAKVVLKERGIEVE